MPGSERVNMGQSTTYRKLLLLLSIFDFCILILLQYAKQLVYDLIAEKEMQVRVSLNIPHIV
jgi:hypothetical protein